MNKETEQYLTTEQFDQFKTELGSRLAKIEGALIRSAINPPAISEPQLSEDEELEKCWQMVKGNFTGEPDYKRDFKYWINPTTKDYYSNTPLGQQAIAYIKMQVIAMAMNKDSDVTGGYCIIFNDNGDFDFDLHADWQTNNVYFNTQQIAETVIRKFPNTCRQYCGVK